MAAGIKGLAQNLQSMGRNGDSILAHIMPEEAAMLKRMGGSGTINPKTGLLEFFGFSDFGGGMVSEGAPMGGVNYNDGGAGFGSQDVNTGGGGYSWSGGGGSSGNGRDSSPSVGSSTSGGGGSFSDFGGGMVSSGAPMGGVNYSAQSFGGGGGSSFGVPTIVSNAFNTISNAASSVANMLGLSMQGGQSTYQSMYAPFAPAVGALMQAIPTPGSQIQGPPQEMVQGPDGGMYIKMPNGSLLDPASNTVRYPATFYSGTETNFVSADRRPALPIGTESPTMSESEMAQNYRPSQYDFVPQTTQVASGMFGQPQMALSSFEPTQSFRQAASSFDTLAPTGIAGLPVPQQQAIAPTPTTTLLADRLPNAPGIPAEPQPTEVASVPQMSGTYEVSVQPLIDAYKKELGAYRLVTSDEDLYANAIKSITTSPEFIASGSTLTPSGEPLESGLPSKVIVNAQGADVMFALQQPRRVITDKSDPYYGTLTAYPSTKDVTTVSNLSVPLPPERPSEVGGPTAVAQAPAPAPVGTYFSDVSRVPSIQAPRPSVIAATVPTVTQPVSQPVTVAQSFAELPNSLERTFQSLSGIPYDPTSLTRSVSMPTQDVAEVGSVQQYALAPSVTTQPVVAQAPVTPAPAPAPISVPRPPADIPAPAPAPVQVASLLDEEFDRILSFGGGGGTSYTPPRGSRPSRGDEELIIPPETTPAPAPSRPTTGMDLTRLVYIPSPAVATTSPAYS